MTVFETPLLNEAALFAAEAHRGQKRRYTELPYLVHPLSVADRLLAVGADEATVAAAILHDVLEDTAVTYADLVVRFGHEVATLVAEVTDISTYADGNRAARRAKDRAYFAGASARAQSIKLADIIDNTRTIADLDPGFAKLYLAEKTALFEVLTEGNATLRALAADSLKNAFDTLAL